MNVNDIRQQFIQKYYKKDFEIDKSGVKVVELIGVSFDVDEDTIFGKPNEEYIKKELNWYLSKSLNVNDLENTPKIWKEVADPSGFINSNYGWCVFSIENGNQYDNCVNELKKNPSSRRATMIYNRPSIWKDYNKRGMSDFICTFATQFFIRKGVLICDVKMRSNDLRFGFLNDKFWHQYILNKLANDLNISHTKMIWNAGSLHMYEKDFYLLDHYIKTKEINISKHDYDELYKVC